MLFLKQDFVEKKLLCNPFPHVLKCFTNFRISSHLLAIETGRYNNTPVNERKINVPFANLR